MCSTKPAAAIPPTASIPFFAQPGSAGRSIADPAASLSMVGGSIAKLPKVVTFFSSFFASSTNPHAKSWSRCDNKDSLMTTAAIIPIAITPEMIREHGLTPEEFEKIKQLLGGREPSRTELGIFSVMWSEHCSYKSSRVHLKRLPTRSKLVVQGPGENAGIVDIGDGWACAFKIESHNHPSFIEPFQGAATGVGGILRDIFTMGARPVAVMDSLRFGPIRSAENAGEGASATQAEIHKNHSVMGGVVS